MNHEKPVFLTHQNTDYHGSKYRNYYFLICATLFSSLFLSACSTPYPLDMTKQQWQQLSKDQQTKLLLEEQKNRAAQAKSQQIADNKARELRLQAEIAEKKRLAKLYANPSHGGVLRINIEGGHWQEGKTHYKIQANTFRIARGETKEIELTRITSKGYSHNRDFWVEYRMDGDAIYLREHRYDDNQIILLNRNNWHCGDFYQQQLNDRYQTIKLKLSVFETGSASNCRQVYQPRNAPYPNRIPPMR